MRLFYVVAFVFCLAWSGYFLYSAVAGRTVMNRGVLMSPRTLTVLSVLTAWVGVALATGFVPALAELITLRRSGVVFAVGLVAFIASLAADARRK